MESITALKQELFKKYPYRVELHAHTSPVSGCSQIPPEELIERYHAIGADGVVITNHMLPWSLDNRTPEEWQEFYLKDYYAAVACAEKYGMVVLMGIELRVAGQDDDYLIYGADDDLVLKACDYLSGKTIEDFYHDYHSPDLLIVQAHPFRDRLHPVAPGTLDGFEVFNCHPHHNSRIGLAARHAGVNGIRVGGTDFHHPDHEGMIMARFPVLPKTSKQLVSLLRSRDYLLDVSGSLILP